MVHCIETRRVYGCRHRRRRRRCSNNKYDRLLDENMKASRLYPEWHMNICNECVNQSSQRLFLSLTRFFFFSTGSSLSLVVVVIIFFSLFFYLFFFVQWMRLSRWEMTNATVVKFLSFTQSPLKIDIDFCCAFGNGLNRNWKKNRIAPIFVMNTVR